MFDAAETTGELRSQRFASPTTPKGSQENLSKWARRGRGPGALRAAAADRQGRQDSERQAARSSARAAGFERFPLVAMQSGRCTLPLIALLLFGLSGTLQAQTYTLQPGATVWNDTSVNWLNQNGQPVPYANATSVNPVINGPVAVTLEVPRVCGNLTLNNGVTLTAAPGAFLQVLQGRFITGGGSAFSTINSTLTSFPNSDAIATRGNLQLNRSINFETVPVVVAPGITRLGGTAVFNAGSLTVGSEPNTFARFEALPGAVVNTGNFTVTPAPTRFGIVEASGTTFNIAGDLRIAEGGDGSFLADGGSINVGGVIRLVDDVENNNRPVAAVVLRNSTLTIADNGRPALDGTFFSTGGDIGIAPSVQFPGTRIRVRPGGFLTIAGGNIGFGVNNTIFDTTGGGAVIDARIWGRALIKEGPGILKLTRENYYGGGGQGLLDGTIVRGGFIEFSTWGNLNDGGFLNQAANQSQTPTGFRNIQLNGGGLRWAPGSTIDISPRLRLLNNFSFDLNGNNVSFETPLAGTGGMTKHGAGTLTLAPSNTYAGGTTVRGGFVQFSSLATLGSGTATLDGGGLRWASGNTADVTPRLQPLGAGGGVVDIGANDVNFAAPVTGTGPLTKLGTGTLALNGAHPWTGAFFVDGGAVAVPGQATGKALIAVGAAPGSVATMSVSGANARLGSSEYLEVGSSGNGTLNVTGGGQVTSVTTTALAVQLGSRGEVNVTGSGSSLTAGSALFVGLQGPAVMTVGSGGVATVGQLRLGESLGGSGAFVLATGGTLNVGGANGIRTGAGEGGLYLNGGTLKVTGSSLTTTVPMTLNNTTLIDTSGVDGVFGGALSGPGGFVKIGGGNLYLNSSGSYAGGSTLYGGGIVVPAANALGTGPISVLGGSLQSTGTFSRDVAVTVDGAGHSLSAASFMEIGVGGTGSLTVQNGAQVSTPSTLAFAVLPGGTSGFASVTGAGSSLAVGSTLFVGYNGDGGVSVGGGASVTAGSVMLAFGPSSQGYINLNPGGTLNVGGVAGIAKGEGAGTLNLSGGLLKVTGSDLTTSVPMTLTNLSLVDTSGVTATFNGALSGTGGLAKTGAGRLTLAAANSYSGATQIIAGMLAVNLPTLADGADVALGTGTTLHLAFTGTDTIRRLTISGLLQATGTWGAIGSGATHETALITGPGLLNVTSNGAAAFTITSPAITSGTVGQPYSGTFTQSGAFGAVTWSLTPNSPGALPPGLTLSSAGVVSGIPTQEGGFSFSVRVTDANGFFTDAAGTLSFSRPIITVNNPTTANGRTNVPFNQTFTSSGGSGASTFTLASGSLPGGLTLAANGTLSGTPAQTGTFPITVTATDIYGSTGTGATYALNIQQASNNANLSLLGVSAGHLTPAFTSATTSYQIFVAPDVALLYVTPTAVDPLATITVNGNFTTNGGDSPGIPLVMGANPVSIVVTSSDFTAQKTYTLTATRTGGLVLNGGGLTLLEEGGTFGPGNLAPSGTAFAKDVLPGFPAHTIAHLNDANFGNSNSWIANSARSFAGVSLGATPVRINEFAFGRDNQGVFSDRSLTRYTLQFTTVANPNAATPDASWTTIGTLDYLSAGGANFAAPALRHRYSFTPVMATGLRLVAVSADTGIDEIEIYAQVGLVLNGGGLTLVSEGGTFAPENLARGPNATPFADGVIVGFPAHSIAHLNDGRYGNDFSWLNDIPAPFAGVALGASRTVNRIAFGRDNTGVITDRTFGVFTLQYTNVANPDANTPAGSWTTIGTLDYRFAGGVNFATPSRRHVFSFNPVTATALRLVGSTGNNAIDELEIYRQLPELVVEQPAGTPLTHNTSSVNFGNLLPGDSSTRTFTLTNAGNAPLNLGTLSLSGTHAAQFTLTPPASNTLAQGQSITFTVTFAPSIQGTLAALLHIPSNDPAIADFRVPLAGISGQPPVISGYANQTNFAADSQGLVLFYPAATATDDSGLPPTLSYSHPSGSRFPIGETTVTITATDNTNISATASFTITIAATTNPPAVPVGGSVPQNLARGKTAFAKDVIPAAPHAIAKVNDGLYGNASSWVADTLDSFVGINLGATPIPIHRVAFGRDHTGVQTTRSDGIYTLQFTTVPNPDANTPESSWQTIAAVTYPGSVVNPALRQMYGFPSVFATGFRLKTLAPVFGIGIDELELYGPNTPPTISDLIDQTINEDGTTGALAITIGDAETSVASLTLSGSSSNTTLVPDANIVFGGSGAQRTVTVTPVANGSGSATITLTVSDGNSSSSDTLVLTVNAVNDAPSLSLGTVATHPAGTTGAQTQAGFATVDLGPPDEDAAQAVADFLIDTVSDPAGVLVANSLDIANNGSLTYSLTGVGGTATITARVRDNGGTANGGVDTSAAVQFSVSVTPGADLQIAKTNNRNALVNGQQTLYAIVVANAGPNAVTGANVIDNLPATLINGMWMCVPAQSTATCPSPSAGTGNLNVLVDLGVNQFLRFDLLAEVNGAVGAFVTNTATVSTPAGTTALNTGNDSATDQDPIVPEGMFANGFENSSTALTVPMAREALEKD